MGIYRIKLDNKYNNDSAVDVGVPTFHTVLQYPGSQGSSDPGLAVGQVAQTQDVTAAHAVSSSFVLLLP